MAPHLGHAAVQAVGKSIDLQWSDDALVDLSRFAEFLHEQSLQLATLVADTIIARTEILSRFPRLGRPMAGRDEYRQLVLQVLGSEYVFQYRYDGTHLVMLRVFHAREAR